MHGITVATSKRRHIEIDYAVHEGNLQNVRDQPECGEGEEVSGTEGGGGHLGRWLLGAESSEGAVKARHGRLKKKPDYDKEEKIQEQLDIAVALFGESYDDRSGLKAHRPWTRLPERWEWLRVLFNKDKQESPEPLWSWGGYETDHASHRLKGNSCVLSSAI